MVSRLPRELYDIVMDYLLEADNDDQSSSLKATSLVCRSFAASSQARLFATISLRSPPNIKERSKVGCRLPRAFIPTDSKRGVKSSIEAFSRVVATSPHLLGYVCRLDLHGSRFPLHPALPPDQRDWLNSQSHHLMTFLSTLAPKLRSFGMYTVDWNELLPEVLETIKTIFQSKFLTSLTLEYTTNFPIPVLASCAHLQHLNLRVGLPVGYYSVIPPNAWDDSALAYPVPNHLKLQIISLRIFVPDSVFDWFSTKHCIFDISHLRHLAVLRGHHDLAKIFQICSSSLESLEMLVERPNFSPEAFDAVDISCLTKLRQIHFHVSAPASSPVTGEPRNSLSWVNDLLKRQSQMSVLEEIILTCSIVYKCPPLDLSVFSETDSLLACGKNLPALRSITILVGCDRTRSMYHVIERIKMQMPLLRAMCTVKVRVKPQ